MNKIQKFLQFVYEQKKTKNLGEKLEKMCELVNFLINLIFLSLIPLQNQTANF